MENHCSSVPNVYNQIQIKESHILRLIFSKENPSHSILLFLPGLNFQGPSLKKSLASEIQIFHLTLKKSPGQSWVSAWSFEFYACLTSEQKDYQNFPSLKYKVCRINPITIWAFYCLTASSSLFQVSKFRWLGLLFLPLLLDCNKHMLIMQTWLCLAIRNLLGFESAPQGLYSSAINASNRSSAVLYFFIKFSWPSQLALRISSGCTKYLPPQEQAVALYSS